MWGDQQPLSLATGAATDYFGAAVALEQAFALRPDDGLARQMEQLREKLRIYDDNRRLADSLRLDTLSVSRSRLT